MKKAPPVRLSLRKLLIAMLAVGPVAILPSPLLAAVPTSQPFSVVNGTVTWNGSGNLGTINATTNNAIVAWNTGATPAPFTVNSGDIFNFQVPTGSGILNKVGYTASGGIGTQDNVLINGTLQSNGKVFILANGNITIGGGASISTQGLFLSTLLEPDNFNFSALGNLAFTGAPAAGANITIGNSASQVNLVGPLQAYGNDIRVNNISVSGDMLLNLRTGGNTALTLTGANGNTSITGNLSVTTANINVNQTAATALIVGGNTVLNTNGNATVTLNSNAANNFNTVNATTGSLLLSDVNAIVLGTSTIGTTLSVSAVNDITTSGAVTVASGGTVNLTSTSGAIVFAHNSTVNGTFNATVSAPTASILVNTLGALTTGSVAAPSSGSVSLTTAGALTIGGAITGGNASVTGSSVTANGTGSITATGAAASITATTGSITLPNVTAPGVKATTAGGSITQLTGTALSISTAGVPSTFNAGANGTITLGGANALNNSVIGLTGGTVTINSTQPVTIGGSTIANNLTINTTSSALGNGTVTLGSGFGSAATDMTIGGSLNITTNQSAVTEDPASVNTVFGSVNIATFLPGYTLGTVSALAITNGGTGYTATPTVTFVGGGGTLATATATLTGGTITSVTITAAGTGFTSAPTITFSTSGSAAGGRGEGTSIAGGSVSFSAAQAGVTGGGRYGQFNVTSGNVLLSESTTLNAGTITAGGVTLNGTNADVLITGTVNAMAFSANANNGSVLEGPSGVVNVSGATTLLRSSNSFGTNLSNTGNSFGGTVRIVNGLNNIVVASSNFTLANNSSVTAGSSRTTITTTANGAIASGGDGANMTNTTLNAGGNIQVGGGLFNTLNLLANDTSATSITQNAAVTVNSSLVLGSQGNITLNTVSNNITGSVTLNNVIGDTTVFSARNLTVSGNIAANLTVAAGTAVNGTSTNTFSNPWNVAIGNLNVGGSLTARALNGNTTFGTVSALAITNGGSGFTSVPTVSLVGGGGTGFSATAVLTSGVLTGITVTNGGTGFTSFPTILIGTAGNTTAAVASVTSSGNAVAGTSGTIAQQANTRLHVEGTTDLATFNNNILIGNNGNSFGRVQVSTGGATGLIGSGNITVVEDPTLKVGVVATNGLASLTSRLGSIIEDPAAAVFITANGTSGIVLSAASGSIQLGNQTGLTAGNITAANVTAAGAVQLSSSGDLVLGPTSANSIVVTANSIAQSGALNIFGLSSFTATSANASASGGITLTNAANNFGPLILNVTAPNQSIAITEGSTLNLRSVSMSSASVPAVPTVGQMVGGNGTFTASSVAGDIIDTGLAGVKLGGASVATTSPAFPTVTVIGTGVASLTASAGNIIINDPTSDGLTTAGIAFNANNVTLSVLGSAGNSLVLGAASAPSTATGNLTATSSLGNIGSAGSFRVGGLASFQTGNGNITINQPNTGFGSLLFVGNQVQINESGGMDILTGSSAFGPAQLISGGSITIVPGVGTVTFGNTVAMQATGDITLRQMQAVGILTISHTGTANLSALSNSTDLNGKWVDTNDLGTGPGPRTDPALAPKP
jgi:hypothetical protein